MVKRRQFLLSTAVFLGWTIKGFSYPITKVLGDPGKEYTKFYIERFLKWYQRVWFSFPDHMSREQTKIFKAWLNTEPTFGSELDGQVFVENFLIRHHLKGKQKLHGKLYLGSNQWTPELTQSFNKYVATIVSKKQWSQFEKLSLFGWSWDFDNSVTKIFFRDVQSSQLFQGSKASLLASVSIKNGNIIERAVINPTSEVPAEGFQNISADSILTGFKVETDSGEFKWKLRTRSTFLPKLKTGTLTVAGKHRKEFRQRTDFLDLSKADQIKIYYP